MKLTILITIFTTFICHKSFAKKDLALGVMIGAPIAVSSIFSVSRKNSIDLLFAVPGDDKSFHLHSSYLWKLKNVLRLEGQFINSYYGLGLRYIAGKNGAFDKFGVRIPGALYGTIKNTKVELGIELAPVLNVVEKTELDIDVGVLIRYRFN